MDIPVPLATSHHGFLLGDREVPSVPAPTSARLWSAEINQNCSPAQPGCSAKLESGNTPPQNVSSALRGGSC